MARNIEFSLNVLCYGLISINMDVFILSAITILSPRKYCTHLWYFYLLLMFDAEAIVA